MGNIPGPLSPKKSSETASDSNSTLPPKSPSLGGHASSKSKPSKSAFSSSSTSMYSLKSAKTSSLSPQFKYHTVSKLTTASSLSNMIIKPTNSRVIVKESESETRYISTKIVEIAAHFWNNKINSLTFSEQLEIGVSIYMTMSLKDPSMKKIFKQSFTEKGKIATISLKFLNMLGWLIRNLLQNNSRLPSLLANLGELHRSFGVRICHFRPMLESVHETFAYYFPTFYQIQERYAIDYIFNIATETMMGQSLQPTLEDSSNHLQSLEVCLRSEVGRAYFYRYLQQTWCDEIAIFLQAMQRFDSQTSDKGRFMCARNIIEVSICEKSNLALNLSHDTRNRCISSMKMAELKFKLKDGNFRFAATYFDRVCAEINSLIMENHWRKFVAIANELTQNKENDSVASLHTNSNSSHQSSESM